MSVGLVNILALAPPFSFASVVIVVRPTIIDHPVFAAQIVDTAAFAARIVDTIVLT